MLCQLIRKHRRTRLVATLVNRCRIINNCYENSDTEDREANGEAWLLRRLAQASPQMVFDVGANVGDWASLALEALPEAHLHCFEIVPQIHERLAERHGDSDRVTINDVGLHDAEKEITIRYFPENSALSTVTDFPHAGESVATSGKVITGDDYLAAKAIEHIDFLKLDVEGTEPEVLAGFAQALAAKRIDIIQFEYGQVSILTRFLLKDFYELLGSHGYVIGKIYPDGVAFRDYQLDHENFLPCNFLAVSNERRHLIDRLAE